MVPFDRPHNNMVYIVGLTIALSCIVFELFTFNNIVTLKFGLQVAKGKSKCKGKGGPYSKGA